MKVTVDAYNGTITYYVDRRQRPDHPGVRARPSRTCSPPGSQVPAGAARPLPLPGGPVPRRRPSSTSATTSRARRSSTGPATSGRSHPHRAASDSTGAVVDHRGAERQQRRSQHRSSTTTGDRINPLYLMMQLPGGSERRRKQEFVLQRTFVPAANPNVLTAFIVARSDGTNYGQLVLYDTPDNQDIPSPSKAASEHRLQHRHLEAAVAARPARLAGGPRRRAADPDRRLDPLRPADLRRRPPRATTFPRFKYVAVAYGEHVGARRLDAPTRSRRCSAGRTRAGP